MQINSSIPTIGLIVMEAPLEKILKGEKSWEMRKSSTAKRETIALIKKGSKKIYGTATIIDSIGPLSEEEMLNNIESHGIEKERISSVEYRHAWILTNICVLENPIPYQHKSGSVIWATIDEDAQMALSAQLRK